MNTIEGFVEVQAQVRLCSASDAVLLGIRVVPELHSTSGVMVSNPMAFVYMLVQEQACNAVRTAVGKWTIRAVLGA